MFLITWSWAREHRGWSLLMKLGKFSGRYQSFHNHRLPTSSRISSVFIILTSQAFSNLNAVVYNFVYNTGNWEAGKFPSVQNATKISSGDWVIFVLWHHYITKLVWSHGCSCPIRKLKTGTGKSLRVGGMESINDNLSFSFKRGWKHLYTIYWCTQTKADLRKEIVQYWGQTFTIGSRQVDCLVKVT